MKTFADRLTKGDAAQQTSTGSAFAGESFRARLQRAASEGELDRLQALPWGIGAAFVHESTGLGEAAVFFACRTRYDERYWRLVSASGEILSRDDLPILRVIDPGDRLGCDVPDALDLEALFNKAAEDICERHNDLLTPEARFGALPASQRWALDILRLPGIPDERGYNLADQALSVSRGPVVRRDLSALRREFDKAQMTPVECASRIADIVKSYGLRPPQPTTVPIRISPEDLGVVCYQVVLPTATP